MIGQSKTELHQVFKSFDKDGSGFVDKSELHAIAQQLNQELSKEEVDKLMSVVDINKDGQISFDEFWNWWQFGKNGHLEKLVFTKLKLMNLLKKVNSQFTRFGISIFEKQDNTFDHHYWAINYGDQPCHLRVDSTILYNGKGIAEALNNENKLLKGIQLNPGKFFDVTLIIRALQPETAKQKFQQLYAEFLQKLQKDESPESQEMVEFLSKCDLQVSSNTDSLIIQFTVKHPLVQDFIETQYTPFSEQLGEDVEVQVELSVGVKNGLKKMMKKNQIFIKYLLEGFLVEFKTKFNSSLAKKVFNLGLFMLQQAQSKKMQQKKVLSKYKQAFTFPLLFKHSKFHLQFKNMEDVDAFLKSLGLDELVEDQPNARDLLQELIQQDEIDDFKNPHDDAHIVYQFYQFGKQYLIAKGSAFAQFPNALAKFEFNFEGLADVMECIFREDADDQKKKQK
ncbi:unnamed protein product (macronuclear) [Paramecium tetraurelia]|uniref:Calmodulin n=1 Tax=Paramecium tetraurelia TaxID=5888 RepID=A0EED8_PARTE|nr:uncharacterized protein GSPATT00026001001 [Paramecium tetraurelia]CAK93657.1 unnamed protein product [Paramecium tetraurelia]|eukprot:XP_001461052.1 hypothetical protein (macronuclear) [Paramecium tetraurelia strain d4-2]